MLLRYFFICLLFWGNLNANPAAVTYDFTGGRFGDNLIAYLHAKWLSYHYQIPLLYKPFPYSTELVMDEKEIHYDAARHPYLRHMQYSGQNLFHELHHDCVFIAKYFPEVESEKKYPYYYVFPVDWKNQNFRKIAKEMISTKKELALTYPPQDMLGVALHIRQGGGYDSHDAGFRDPLKFPPITFYIESLKIILDLFKDKSIYCHVFTDALQPGELVNQIQQALPYAPIIFNYREKDNRHWANVLEDFHSLFNFDILIRGESNYSIVPSLLHDYAVFCYPKNFSKHDGRVTIDQIQVEINDELYNLKK